MKLENLIYLMEKFTYRNTSDGELGEQDAAPASGGGQGALSGVDPSDRGVDISSIPGMNNWKHLIK